MPSPGAGSAWPTSQEEAFDEYRGLIAEGIGPQTCVAHLDKSSDIFFELLFGAAKAKIRDDLETARKILKRELRKPYRGDKQHQVN
jgi:hypothetical protein